MRILFIFAASKVGFEYRVGLHLWREGFKMPLIYMRGVYHECGASRSLFYSFPFILSANKS